MPEISFHFVEVDYSIEENNFTSWLEEVCKKEGAEVTSLTYIFVTDAYLLNINQRYLNHDTYTDIVTFNLGDENEIEGEIYISLDRVRENALKYEVTVEKELHRVVVHGLLHLLGYDDHSEQEKIKMRQLENHYLAQL